MTSPFSVPRRRAGWICFGALLLLTPLVTRADRRVTVRATADEDYVESRLDESGQPRIEKYVFVQGQFSPGAFADKSLDKTEISEIARTLAPYLARKDYWPTKTIGDADIVIAVHWGMTVSLKHNTDYTLEMMNQARERQMQAKEMADALYGSVENDGIDPRSMTADGAATALKEEARAAASSPDYEWVRMTASRSEHEVGNRPTASVLGFTDVFNQDAGRAFTGEDATTLRSMLDEERYFVVLAAYDLRGREPGESPKRIWVARLSIRSPGTNFTEALQKLGEAGSHYFGENLPDLTIERVPAKSTKAEVEVGDAIVVEEPPPAPR